MSGTSRIWEGSHAGQEIEIRNDTHTGVCLELRRRAESGSGSIIIGSTWDECYRLYSWCEKAHGHWSPSSRAIAWGESRVTALMGPAASSARTRVIRFDDRREFRGLTFSAVWSNLNIDALLMVDEIAMSWRGENRVLLRAGPVDWSADR